MTGLLLAAVMLFPFIELLQNSDKLGRGVPANQRSVLLTLFMPDLWGRPDASFGGFGPANYFERNMYIGAVPLLLAAVGLVYGQLRTRLLTASLAILGLLLSIQVPFVSDLIRKLPVIAKVNTDRALIITVFALVMLAATGLDCLLRAEPRQRKVVIGLVLGVAALPVLWYLSKGNFLGVREGIRDLPFIPGHPSYQAAAITGSVMRWCLLAAGAALVIFLLLWAKDQNKRLAAAIALVLLAVIDSLTLLHGIHGTVPNKYIDPVATPAAVTIAKQNLRHGHFIGAEEALIPNSAELFQLPDVRRHELPVVKRTYDLYQGLGGWGEQATRYFFHEGSAGKLINTFGVTVAISGADVPKPSNPALKLIGQSSNALVYANTQALPRAWLAYSWRTAKSEQDSLTTVKASTRDQLYKTPVIEGLAARTQNQSSSASTEQTGRVSFLRDDAQEVRLRVNATAPAQLILLDAYYPGWQAEVDGKRAKIRPGNTAFRAISVAPGTHTVVFRYHPHSFYYGLFVSLLTLFLLLLVAVYIYLYRGRKQRLPLAR